MFLPRLFSTIILLGLFSASVFWQGDGGRVCFTVLAVAGILGAVWEFAKIIEKQDMPSYPLWTGFAVLLPVLGMLWKDVAPIEIIFLLVGLVIAFCVCLWIQLLCSGNRLEILKKIMNSAAMYVLFIVPFFILAAMQDDRMMFLYLILGTKIGDIGAYVVGSLSNKITCGRNHKLIPSISPGKSWEGLIGGLLISIGFAFALFPAVTHHEFPVWIPVIPGVLLFFFGAAGDLAESSLKRICGVKDSGRILPGIGGVLDLVDSLMINAPVFVVMMHFLDMFFLKK